MEQTKYGKYIIKEPMYRHSLPTVAMSMHLCGECDGIDIPDFPGELSASCITEPLTMSPVTHAHDFDQFLFFLGSDPRNFFEFGAEIEITLGEEGEKHTIDTTSIIYIPKGLKHCPLVFKKVDKPVMFMHVGFSSKYNKVGETVEEKPHSERKRFSQEEILKLRGNKE